MEKQKYELPFPRYIRKGKCNKCGWCCLKEDLPCPHLTFNPSGKARCSIHHNTERPKRCVLFPEMPPILHDKCGYWFIDRWEDSRKLGVGEV